MANKVQDLQLGYRVEHYACHVMSCVSRARYRSQRQSTPPTHLINVITIHLHSGNERKTHKQKKEEIRLQNFLFQDKVFCYEITTQLIFLKVFFSILFSTRNETENESRDLSNQLSIK